jgi:LmbE family N-acetylglucosaminyl deacetylase
VTVARYTRSVARKALLARARDVTEWAAHRSALVIAPHPDDETLGCGARILHARQAGSTVTIVVATDGARSHDSVGTDPNAIIAMRREELAQATQHLGLPPDNVIQLGYPDCGLMQHLDDFAADIARLIKDLRPDDVYTTCSAEPHPDHAAAARAVSKAIATIVPSPRLLEYPIWLWSEWPLSRRYVRGDGLRQLFGTWSQRSVEKVSLGSVRDSKVAALRAYSSQLGGDQDPDSTNNDQGREGVALPAEVVHRALNDSELFFRRR